MNTLCWCRVPLLAMVFTGLWGMSLTSAAYDQIRVMGFPKMHSENPTISTQQTTNTGLAVCEHASWHNQVLVDIARISHNNRVNFVGWRSIGVSVERVVSILSCILEVCNGSLPNVCGKITNQCEDETFIVGLQHAES